MAETSTDCPVIKPKKRKKNFTHKEQLKFQRISSHERGDDCKCKMKCFEAITDKEKDGLLNQFNSISSKDAQRLAPCFLCSGEESFLIPISINNK